MSKWLRWYLLCCGIAAHLAGLALLALILALGPRGLYERGRDAFSGIIRHGLELRSTVHDWRARHRTLSLGLQTVRDAAPALAAGAAPDAAGGRRILRVGPGHELRTPGAAARVANDGDIVEIEAGVYRGESVRWAVNNLTVRGVGGFAEIDVSGTRLVQEKGAWLVQGDRMRIEAITFRGARSRDHNGAGIRAEGDGLHVLRCRFLDNETGILSNPLEGGRIVVEFSEFARNGHPDGQAHQIYIGDSVEFVLRGSYVHDTVIGSAVKSRARTNVIEYNRIVDGAIGRSNYTIDLSEGGRAFVIGNELEQGPYSGNSRLIAFGPERRRGDDELYLVHNTLVNDHHAGSFAWNNTDGVLHAYNNLMIGGRTAIEGDALLVGNVHASETWWPFDSFSFGGLPGSTGNHRVRIEQVGIASRVALDYRLVPSAPAVDAGLTPAAAATRSLAAAFEYLHPAATRPRVAVREADVGAHELVE